MTPHFYIRDGRDIRHVNLEGCASSVVDMAALHHASVWERRIRLSRAWLSPLYTCAIALDNQARRAGLPPLSGDEYAIVVTRHLDGGRLYTDARTVLHEHAAAHGDPVAQMPRRFWTLHRYARDCDVPESWGLGVREWGSRPATPAP